MSLAEFPGPDAFFRPQPPLGSCLSVPKICSLKPRRQSWPIFGAIVSEESSCRERCPPQYSEPRYHRCQRGIFPPFGQARPMEFDLPLYAVQRLADGTWLVRSPLGDPLWPAVDVVAVIGAQASAAPRATRLEQHHATTGQIGAPLCPP